MEHTRKSFLDQSVGLVFFGGEPLLKRDVIAEVVRYCRSFEGQDFHFKMTTNGTLLDESFLTDADTSDVFVALEP